MNGGNQSQKGKIGQRHNLIMQIPYPIMDQLFFIYQTIEFKIKRA